MLLQVCIAPLMDASSKSFWLHDYFSLIKLLLNRDVLFPQA